jgi:archaellum component FlaC
LKIKILNEEILKTRNIITSIKDGLVDVRVDAYEDELQRLNKEHADLVIELDKIKQTFNTLVDKSKQIKGGKSRKLKR